MFVPTSCLQSFFYIILHLLLSVGHSSNLHHLSSFFHEINPLNAELSPICHLLALLVSHHILHISRIMVNAYSILIKSQKCYFTFCCPSTWWQPQQLITYFQKAKRSSKCRIAAFFLFHILQANTILRNLSSTHSTKSQIPHHIVPVCTPYIRGCKVREPGEIAGWIMIWVQDPISLIEG